ncbi:MAG: PIN domain-containing protein [Chloroflexi bacterium]|nr:PIN domain-containing protein [Chloroflexota bacterium]
MAEVIADTSALIAFFVRSEARHQDARQYMATHSRTRWLILASVFDETVTWFRVKVSPQASITIGRILREEHRYVNLSDDDDSATWEAFCQYDDKAWSYTDCSILVMARRLGISQVFAFDDHIRQMAGLGITSVPATTV